MLTKEQITFIKGYLFKELGIALNLSIEEVDKEIKEFLKLNILFFVFLCYKLHYQFQLFFLCI